MATSLLPSQKGKEFKEQFLTCPICYESYDIGEHQAKCLPCLHTFCLSCLESHAGKRPKFNCPQCRKEIIPPDQNVDSLPNNFVVENLKEYEDLINRAVVCGDCDDGNQAVSFCHDCGLFLCQGCVDDHRRKRSQRHHKLSTMEDLQQQNYRPRKEKVCEKHPTQTLTLYCKEAACKIPVCACCGLVDHRGHELVDLTAAVDEIVAEIKQSSAQLNDRSQELIRKKITVETQKKQLAQSSEKTIKDIDELEDKLIKLVKSKCSQAKVHVKQHCETEMKNLTTKIESIDNITAQVTNACEFANKACDMNHPTQLLTSQHQITDRLRELEHVDFPETISDKTEFTFTHSHQSALAQIQESMQYLCDTTWLQCTGSRVGQKGYLVEPSNLKNRQHGIKPDSASAESKPLVDPKQCTMKSIRTKSFMWQKTLVQTLDTSGQLMTTGSAKVQATQGGSSLQVQDNKDGTYTFEYSPLLGPIQVQINGTPIRGSPVGSGL